MCRTAGSCFFLWFAAVCLCVLPVAAADGSFTTHGPGAEAGQIQRRGPRFWCAAAFDSSSGCAFLRTEHAVGGIKASPDKAQDRLPFSVKVATFPPSLQVG